MDSQVPGSLSALIVFDTQITPDVESRNPFKLAPLSSGPGFLFLNILPYNVPQAQHSLFTVSTKNQIPQEASCGEWYLDAKNQTRCILGLQ